MCYLYFEGTGTTKDSGRMKETEEATNDLLPAMVKGHPPPKTGLENA